MKWPFQKTTWETALKSNLFLSISNVTLAVALLVSVFHSVFTKPDTILVPPVVNEQMKIGLNSANEAYIKSFGLYAATLIANITQANADFVVDSISQFIDPAIYPDIRKQILAAAQTSSFKEAAAATKFVPHDVIYEPDTSKVFILGDSSIITSVGAQSPRPLVIEMTIHIKDKLPVISTLDTYEGAIPHTLAWLKDNTPQNQPQQQNGAKQ